MLYSEALWDAEDFIVPVRLYGDGAESYRNLLHYIRLSEESYIVSQIDDTRALGTQNFEIFLLQSVLGEETSCMSTRFLFPGPDYALEQLSSCAFEDSPQDSSEAELYVWQMY